MADRTIASLKEMAREVKEIKMSRKMGVDERYRRFTAVARAALAMIHFDARTTEQSHNLLLDAKTIREISEVPIELGHFLFDNLAEETNPNWPLIGPVTAEGRALAAPTDPRLNPFIEPPYDYPQGH
jgi:hypothetical protein